jgi:hypothetical protein
MIVGAETLDARSLRMAIDRRTFRIRRIQIVATAAVVLGCLGCSVGPTPAATPTTPAASEARTAPAVDTVEAAIARWRQAPKLSGRYRAVYDTGAVFGARNAASASGRPLLVQEGTFAKQGIDRFRATGSQRFESTVPQSTPNPTVEVDVLFSSRTLLLVNKAAGHVPSTPQVTRIGSALFEEGQPFKLKTVLNGSAFGRGDVATTVEALASAVRFERPDRVVEEGETLTVHVGRLDVDRALGQWVAERQVSLGMFVQTLGQTPLDPAMVDLQLTSLADLVRAQEVVRVLVDEHGWLRGWDVGASPDASAMTVRLSRLAPTVADNAFAIDAALEQQAVDQTPALLAQTVSLQKSFDDVNAVERARLMLREAVERSRSRHLPAGGGRGP